MFRRPIRRAINRDMRRGISGAADISRYFTDFKKSNGAYIQLSSSIDIGAGVDFEIRFKNLSPTDLTYAQLGSSASGNDRIFTTGGYFNGVIAGTSLFSIRQLQTGNLDEVVIARQSNSVTLTVNGSGSGSVSASGAVSFDLIGDNFFNNLCNGFIADIEVWVGGVNVLDMPIDESDLSGGIVSDQSASNNTGTAYNFLPSDSKLYTLSGDQSQWESGDGDIIPLESDP